MELEEIVQRFSLLAGLTPEQAAPWHLLCNDALLRIQSQCRETTEAAEQSGLLCAAASALAFYWYMLGQDAGCSDSFTAGEVKLGASHGADAAKQLWLDARSQIAHLLRDEGFFFTAVTAGRHVDDEA